MRLLLLSVVAWLVVAPVAAADVEWLGPGVARVEIRLEPGDDPITVRLDGDGRRRLELFARPIEGFGRAGVPGIELSWRAAPDETITGLGQRFEGVNLAGRVTEMWIEDAPLQHAGRSYYCVPIVYSTAGYALCATDNPEGHFDLNSSGDGQHRYRRASTHVELIVVLRPDLRAQVEAVFTHLGLPRSVPEWAFEPWISKNSYESQAEAEDAIRGMLERDIPVGVIVQEAWKGPSDQGAFNRWEFPGWDDVPGFLAWSRANGVRNVLWQVPVLHPTSPHFAAARDRGYLVMTPEGEVSLREHWLRGFANLDFTNPDAVRWWQDQMRPLVRAGVYGFKADDGEDIKATDIFRDGSRGWEMHNEYSVLYARAIAELFEQERVEGVIWARSGSLGQQAYPALWAGDQEATWEQMRSLIPAGLTAGVSGAPFWSHDIGGYIGTCDEELYIRWAQFGTFSPLMQYHGVESREPWAIGPEAERVYGDLARLRIRLKPYLIRLSKEAERTAAPLMRPMRFEFPDAPNWAEESEQYMLGDELLVAPVLDPGAPGRVVRFPPGVWRQIGTAAAFTGPGAHVVPISYDTLPAFVAGAGPFLNEGDPIEAVLYNLTAPLNASVAPTPVELSFRAEPGLGAAVRWHWSDAPEVVHTAPLRREGAGLRADLSAPIEERRSARRQVYIVRDDRTGTVLYQGEVWYRDPIELAEPGAIHTVTADAPLLRLPVVNPLTDPVQATLTLASETLEVPVERAVTLEPGETRELKWPLRGIGNRIGRLPVQLQVRVGGHLVAEHEPLVHGGSRWAVVGPFLADAPYEQFGALLGPGYIQSPDVRFGTNGPMWRAVPREVLGDAGELDLAGLLGAGDHRAGYAMTRFDSESRTAVELRFGSDDTLMVWFNGRLVSEREVYRGGRHDQEVIPVVAEPGTNTVVAQVCQGTGGWGVLFRITGTDGAATLGLSDGFVAIDDYRGDRAVPTTLVSVPEWRWQIAGPILLDESGPSRGSDLPTDTLANEVSSWDQWRESHGDPGRARGLDLRPVSEGSPDCVVYLRTSLDASEAKRVRVVAQSDDGFVCWHNGSKVYASEAPQAFGDVQHDFEVTLRPGPNRIVLRVSQFGGDHRVAMRLYDAASGVPLRLLSTGD